jgi:hypothetical protein
MPVFTLNRDITFTGSFWGPLTRVHQIRTSPVMAWILLLLDFTGFQRKFERPGGWNEGIQTCSHSRRKSNVQSPQVIQVFRGYYILQWMPVVLWQLEYCTWRKVNPKNGACPSSISRGVAFQDILKDTSDFIYLIASYLGWLFAGF